ncbi:MAG: hypothetical protein CMN57_05110 [Gammaproteobacteria bacterium]|nr:hypothetical protein [Gammaproteobacteria bacterium]|tara:strand:+ start:182 stop:418 length:237 start_codon:yes stop_codon:yes gene_type:complete
MTRQELPMGTGDARDTTTAPDFHHQDRFVAWRYRLRTVPGDLVMIASEPITRDEALRGLAQHYGCHNVVSLAGGTHAG